MKPLVLTAICTTHFFASLSLAALLHAETSESQLTYDLSLSRGSRTTNGESYDYSEFHLGLNYRFSDWFTWRNSGFYRTVPQGFGDDYYGLDSSARFTTQVDLSETSYISLFAGAGARIPSEGRSAPLADGGVTFQFGGLRLGAGAKIILNSLVYNDSSIKDDVQYFLTLAGGGTL